MQILMLSLSEGLYSPGYIAGMDWCYLLQSSSPLGKWNTPRLCCHIPLHRLQQERRLSTYNKMCYARTPALKIYR
jgi:hypothetical protein